MRIKEEYLGFLESYIEFSIHSKANYIDIKTPFLNSHNDHIEFILQKNESKCFFTDKGNTIDDLIFIKSKYILKRLDKVICGFGAVRKGDAIIMEVASEDNLGVKMHMFIQALILASHLSCY